MATKEEFVIRRTFLLPLGLLLLLCLTLFFTVLVQGEARGKVIILGVLILPVGGLFLESLFRRVRLEGDEVTVFKLLRRRSLRFPEITAVETIQVRKRAFLTLCAGEDFVILSNAYGNFPRMVDLLLARVPESSISEETRTMAAKPPRKSTDIVSCWLAVALVGLILFLQLGGRF